MRLRIKNIKTNNTVLAINDNRDNSAESYVKWHYQRKKSKNSKMVNVTKQSKGQEAFQHNKLLNCIYHDRQSQIQLTVIQGMNAVFSIINSSRLFLNLIFAYLDLSFSRQLVGHYWINHRDNLTGKHWLFAEITQETVAFLSIVVLLSLETTLLVDFSLMLANLIDTQLSGIVAVYNL